MSLRLEFLLACCPYRCVQHHMLLLKCHLQTEVYKNAKLLSEKFCRIKISKLKIATRKHYCKIKCRQFRYYKIKCRLWLKCTKNIKAVVYENHIKIYKKIYAAEQKKLIVKKLNTLTT